MKRFLQSQVFATGMAMFSMFFGAGNVVFPLALGRSAGANNIYAILGFLITAVGVPFLGLVGMVLFNGDYKKFFYRIGKVPGFFTIFFIICIIGPFNATARCVTLSHAAVHVYFPGINLLIFSIIAGILIFVLSIKESKILDILGYFLSPVLLLCLATVIIFGLFSGNASISSLADLSVADLSVGAKNLFTEGIVTGYNTMDLLATFFFSAIVLSSLKLSMPDVKDYKRLANLTLKASCIGASLLGIVYIGMSFVASFHGSLLYNVPKEQLLIYIADSILGSSLGLVAAAAVALACLTTAITLVAVFTDFIRFEIFNNKIAYVPTLIGTVIITTVVANLGFDNIVAMAVPILVVLYPAIIALAIVNISYKLFGFQPVKVPFYGTFLISLFWSLFG